MDLGLGYGTASSLPLGRAVIALALSGERPYTPAVLGPFSARIPICFFSYITDHLIRSGERKRPIASCASRFVGDLETQTNGPNTGE